LWRKRRKHREKLDEYCAVFAIIMARVSNIRRNLPLLNAHATRHLS